jgi:holo-[acyl-carrier protein] synthase
MKIYQGVDIVEISKLKKVFTNNKDFATDIFTEKERDYCFSKKDPFPHFAARFAAKEAGLKALGMGMSGTGIDNSFQEIEVVRSKSGKPGLFLSGWIQKISRKKNVDQLTVSISHSADYAVATVIMTGN